MFAFQTLGVMADAAEAIATDRDVRVCTLADVNVCVRLVSLCLQSVVLLTP